MDYLIERGLELIITIQSWGDWLIAPMRFFTFLGLEEFFFLVLPAVYWTIDARLGLQIGYLLILSNGMNSIFKLLFHAPRPYWLSAQVRPWTIESSFGVPSGHAQNAVGIWGLMAYRIGRNWAYFLGFGIAFLVGFSRLFLGVHFPHDVIVGWLIGGVLLWLFIKLWKPVSNWLSTQSLGRQIGLAFLASFLIAGLGVAVGLGLQGYEIPQEWLANLITAGGGLPDPISLEGIITSAGTLFGFGAGAALINSLGGYATSGPLWKRILRYLLGLAGILILWRGLGGILPRGEEFIPYLLRYLRYALVGFWVSAGAPWLFFHIKLAAAPKP